MTSVETLVAVMLVFFLAGTVKGVVGFGLPLVSISLLTPLYGLVDAVGLMLIPAIVTNFWQAVSGDRLAALWRRLWTLLAPAMVFTWLAANVLAQVDTRWFTVLLGIVIFTYSLAGLTSWQLPEPGRREKWLSPVIGIISGVLTGLTGVAVFPFVSYLHAIRLDWQALFQVMGVWFLVASSIIVFVFARHDLLPWSVVSLGITGVVTGLVGMVLGQMIRKRLSEQVFRQVFFAGLALVGIYVTIRALWA
ncbi:MAG: hypothetical protein CL394_01580 [Acidiferrobacteraceae bacterium]|nr:hypothetical protein [Acidiferrobacteraceae bacterium]